VFVAVAFGLWCRLGCDYDDGGVANVRVSFIRLSDLRQIVRVFERHVLFGIVYFVVCQEFGAASSAPRH
jgi:hypothetical protein